MTWLEIGFLAALALGLALWTGDYFAPSVQVLTPLSR